MTRELIAHIFSLAKQYSRLCGDSTEHLSFEEYNNILEYEIKLNAFGNLLSVSDTTKFLQDEIDDADSYLDSLRQSLIITDVDKKEPK